MIPVSYTHLDVYKRQGLAIARKLKISPVPVIIAIAVSSNLQGAATLVGDTTSILLGSFAFRSSGA